MHKKEECETNRGVKEEREKTVSEKRSKEKETS